MTIDEVNGVIEGLRKEGYSDEQIVYSFSMLFLNKQINAEAYVGLVDLVGYILKEDFINMKEKEQIKFVKKLINMK